MNEDRIRDDLSYVRSLIHRAEGVNSPASSYFLWALLSFFGYAIIDFDPERTGLYWMIAGPVGGVLSGVLARRNARRTGQVSDRGDWTEFLHWTALFVVILLSLPLVTTGRIAVIDLPRIILLLVGFAYWTAGAHVDRRMLPLAGVIWALYVFTVLAPGVPYLWTITGAGLAAGLTAAGLFARARARNGGKPT